MGIGTLSVPGLAPVTVPHVGAVRSVCGMAAVSVGGARVPLRVTGTVGALDAGLPLSAATCAGPVTMAAGTQEVGSLPGTFSVDLLRLRSPAPVPLPTPTAASGPRLISAGHLGNDSVSGVRVALTRPAWLVLGESYDTGWQARCDGRTLGAPKLIDGYANGWLAPADCRNVSFTFAPQSTVNVGYVISGLVALALLLLLIVVRPPRLAAGARGHRCSTPVRSTAPGAGCPCRARPPWRWRWASCWASSSPSAPGSSSLSGCS